MKIDKKKLITALIKVSGFDFELEMYRLAGSFEKALDLFFERTVASLKAINRISYNLEITAATIVNLKSKEEIKENIERFLTKVYDDTFIRLIQQYLEIVKMYPCTLKKKNQVLEKMRKYQQELDMELKTINETASELFKWGKHYKISKNQKFSKYLDKLETLSVMSTIIFFAILKATFKDTIVDNKLLEESTKK